MYKLICFILISQSALISAESNNQAYETSENSITTEIYRTKYEDILMDIEKIDNDGLVTEATEYGHQSNDVSMNVSTSEKVTEILPPSSPMPKFNKDEAEAEIKGWSDKLDCETSSLGEFKCTLLKKLVKKFFENIEGIETKKLVARIKVLVKKLEDSDTPMDPEMRNLIKKYKKFL